MGYCDQADAAWNVREYLHKVHDTILIEYECRNRRPSSPPYQTAPNSPQ
jgi:hypothetical protein